MKNILKIILITSLFACIAVAVMYLFTPEQEAMDLERKLERQKCVTEFYLKAKNYSNTLMLAKKQGLDFETIRLKVQQDTTLSCDEINSLWSDFQTKVLNLSGAQ